MVRFDEGCKDTLFIQNQNIYFLLSLALHKAVVCMKSRRILTLLIFAVLSLTAVLNTGCNKDLLLSDEALDFSLDTVVFDTVFTTVGSSTRRFKIYNRSNNPVQVTSVSLEGGSSSPFRVNLDGNSGVSFDDFTIPGNDSLFMFVEVTLDPNNQTLPLIIEDRIRFFTNGEEQFIRLAAWGQDAYFHFRDLNSGTWPNDKPHVIYDFAAVDSAEVLNIQPGTRIYLHNESLLYIFKSTLNINGGTTEAEKVIFQGDRLEPFYDDVKGQYYGIYLEEARSSTIDNVIIKNGTAGIHVFGSDPSNTDYTLRVTNSEIYNNSSYGIFNYSGGRIYGENLSVHNNGLYSFFLLEGGDYSFRHCQFLGIGTDGNQPAVAIKNYFTRADGFTYIGPVNEGKIFNSILHGDSENQVVYDTITDNGAVSIDYEYAFNLIKQEDSLGDAFGVGNIWNQNPQFDTETQFIYKIVSSSPCNDAGSSSYAITNDLEGNTRNVSSPDIGAYEID